MSKMIRVKDSTIVLLVNHVLESARATYYAPMLAKFGMKKLAPSFDHSKYEELNPLDRCFDNAMETVLRYPGLTYMEGVCLFLREGESAFALPHGWCEDQYGRIVDPTNAKHQGHPSVAYYGLPIRTDYHQAWRKRVGYYGCLDGDRCNRPIGIHYEDPSVWLANAINRTGATS